MLKKDSLLVWITLIIVVTIISISDLRETGYIVIVGEKEVLTETLEPIEEVEEENIIGRAIRLDECLGYCQYKICSKNCGKDDGNLDSNCFRKCLDECNEKCLKVYA